MLRHFTIAARMASAVRDADIDPTGVFKYILIKVNGKEANGEKFEKHIVRGYAECPFHTDIDDKTTEELQKLKSKGEIKEWSTKVLGGGRIKHDADGKSLNVYGYSQGFGKADHEVAVAILKKAYPEYAITWSDEGY